MRQALSRATRRSVPLLVLALLLPLLLAYGFEVLRFLGYAHL